MLSGREPPLGECLVFARPSRCFAFPAHLTLHDNTEQFGKLDAQSLQQGIRALAVMKASRTR